MALPKLNDLPLYDVVIPSSKKKVKFRPYLVKEEKVLMMAMETQDNKQIMNAVVDTIMSCVQEDINRRELTSFDVEYLFLQMRAKSVGETSTVKISCSNCEHKEDVSVDLSKIQAVSNSVNAKIALNDTISIEMMYPSFDAVLDASEQGITSQTELAFNMIAKCIKSIKTEEEIFRAGDVTDKELIEFIESMNNEQFEKVNKFLESIPRVSKDVEFKCSSCGHENKLLLEGLSNFF
jgi:hypothetical protein